MTDTLLDRRIHAIMKRLEKLTNEDLSDTEDVKTDPERISSKFGLSISQARAWLKREPNFISRRKVTTLRWKDKTDEDVTEPETRFCYLPVGFFSVFPFIG